MKLSYWKISTAKNDYGNIAEGIQYELPEALKDPVIAAALAQMEIGRLALYARLDQLSDEDDEV